jgi:hypothetical protein
LLYFDNHSSNGNHGDNIWWRQQQWVTLRVSEVKPQLFAQQWQTLRRSEVKPQLMAQQMQWWYDFPLYNDETIPLSTGPLAMIKNFILKH